MLKKLLLLTLIFTSYQLFGQEIFKEFTPSKYSYVRLLGKTEKSFLMMTYTFEHGYEPWYSDGTPEGTVLLKDIHRGYNSSYISNWCYSTDSLYFFLARDTFLPIENIKLYRSNGLPEGTYPIFNFKYSFPTDYNQEGAILNNRLYFPVTDSSGTKIWESDGTLAGTKLFFSDTSSIEMSEVNMFVFDNQLFFSYNTRQFGNELWVSDGTTSGTHLFKDIKTGIESGLDRGFNPIICNGKMYFLANKNDYVGSELFESDGTPNGTNFILEVNSYPYSSSVINYFKFDDEKLLISGTNFQKIAVFVYNTNTKSLNKILPSSSDPENSAMVYFGNQTINKRHIITILDNQLGAEMFQTDGTEANTKLVKDIDPGLNSGVMYPPVNIGNKLYFFGFNSQLGVDIWSTDGLTEHTVIAKEFANPGQVGDAYFSFNNLFFFNAIMDGDSILKFYVWDVSKSTNIDIKKTKNDLNIYPNPVKRGENIHINEMDEFKFSIYDLNGKEIVRGHSNSGNIPINHQVSVGNCILKIESDKGIYYLKVTIE